MIIHYKSKSCWICYQVIYNVLIDFLQKSQKSLDFWIVPTEEKEHEENEKKKQKKGKQPDDLFTIITFVDSYNFKNNRAYSGEGISLHLIVTRKDLEKFANELEIEYRNLRS